MQRTIRTTEEVQDRVQEIEERLALINRAIAKEKERPFFQRRRGVCHFLDLEKKVYSNTLKALKWVIYEKE